MITTQPLIVPAVPRWVAIGLGEIGVVEDKRAGKTHSRIPQYHAATTGGTALDDIAWCSSFLCFVMEQAGIRSTRNKTAISWARWGERTLPRLGAVGVFPPTDPDAGGTGHVGIALGVSGSVVYLLGGNQQDRVSIASRQVAKAIDWRWPAAVQVTLAG